LWGNYLFAASKNGSISVVNVSVPWDINLVTKRDVNSLDGVTSPHDCAIIDDHLIVVNQEQNDSIQVAAYNVIQVTSGRAKETIGSPSSTVANGNMNGANRVDTDGVYAYVSGNYSDTVMAIDFTDKTAPVSYAPVSVTGTDPDGQTLGNGRLYVGASDTIDIFDISDPTNISVESSLTDSALVGLHDMELYGRFLVVTSQHDDRLVFIELGHFQAQAVETDSVKTAALHVSGRAFLNELEILRELKVNSETVIKHPGVARAWIEYDGSTNTASTAYSVDSVTDDGVGQYTVVWQFLLEGGYVVAGLGDKITDIRDVGNLKIPESVSFNLRDSDGINVDGTINIVAFNNQ